MSVNAVSFLSVILLVVSMFGLILEGKANCHSCWYDEFIYANYPRITAEQSNIIMCNATDDNASRT